MASHVVMNVRYFGTSKVKVAGRMVHFEARVDENGQLDLDMGGLQKKIRSLCNLPLGADITMVYIDEDGDVVTLVDDDDLHEAWKQQLKCFRIDVMMNVDNDKPSGTSASLRSPQAQFPLPSGSYEPECLDLAPSAAAAASNDLKDDDELMMITGIVVADYLFSLIVPCFERIDFQV